MGDCIETPNKRTKDGYGRTSARRFGKSVWTTHRLVWIDANGRLPEGHVLHTCDNPPCVNIEHLYEGTHQQNMKDRSDRGRTSGQSDTHCSHGHEFTEDNTYYPKRGGRMCRTCHASRMLARYHATKELTSVG